MGAVSLASGNSLLNTVQQNGYATKADVLKQFDSNGDGKIGKNQSANGTTGVSELDAAHHNLGEETDTIVGYVNDAAFPETGEVIVGSYDNGDFEAVDPRTAFGLTGVPRE